MLRERKKSDQTTEDTDKVSKRGYVEEEKEEEDGLLLFTLGPLV